MSSDEGSRITEEGGKALKSVAKGGGIVFLGLLFSRIFSYLFRMVVARFLGPTDYGLISIGMAVLGFSSSLALLGLPAGLKKYISHYKAKEMSREVKETVFSGVRASLLVSLVVSAAIFLSSDFLAVSVFNEPSAGIIIKIFALVLPFQALLKIFTSCTDAFQEMKFGVISKEIVGKFSKLVVTVLLILLGFGALSAAYGYLVSFIVSATVSFYFVYTKVYPYFKGMNRENSRYRELLTYSTPLLFSGMISSLFIGWLDIFMLGFFKPASEVGIYNVAYPTAILLLTFFAAVNRITFPVMSDLLSKEKKDELKNIYKIANKWVFSLTFPAFLLMVFFSHQIITLLFGRNYGVAALPLSILALAYLVRTFTGSSTGLLKTINKTKVILMNTVFVSILNVSLNYLLIPKFGATGAAMATGTSLISWNILMLAEIYYFLKLHPYKKSLYKPVLASIISVSAVYFVVERLFDPVPDLVLILAFVLFLVLYLALLLLLRGLEEEDILILKAIERKTDIEIEWLRNMIKRFI